MFKLEELKKTRTLKRQRVRHPQQVRVSHCSVNWRNGIIRPQLLYHKRKTVPREVGHPSRRLPSTQVLTYAIEAIKIQRGLTFSVLEGLIFRDVSWGSLRLLLLRLSRRHQRPFSSPPRCQRHLAVCSRSESRGTSRRRFPLQSVLSLVHLDLQG